MASMVDPPRPGDTPELSGDDQTGQFESNVLVGQRGVTGTSKSNTQSNTQASGSFLNEEYTIDTPENVTFGYEVAGIGSRFIGALIDTLIVFVAWILLSIAAFLSLVITEGLEGIFSSGGSELSWAGGLAAAGYSILSFLLFWAYYIVFEHIWNGQTPGKRVAKTRVLRLDGNPIGLLQNLVRNVVRIADFFPTAYAIGLVTMFCNRHARRLGDFAAGTIVVRDQGEMTLNDLSGSSGLGGEAAADGLSSRLTAPVRASDPLLQQFPRIHLLSIADYELVSDALARYQQEKIALSQLNRLAPIVAKKIEAQPPSPANGIGFLQNVAEAYRRAEQ